jgi:hypothetical protein
MTNLSSCPPITPSTTASGAGNQSHRERFDWEKLEYRQHLRLSFE